jgi:hypothetical protein
MRILVYPACNFCRFQGFLRAIHLENGIAATMQSHTNISDYLRDATCSRNSSNWAAKSPRFAGSFSRLFLYTAFHGHNETPGPYAVFPPRRFDRTKGSQEA